MIIYTITIIPNLERTDWVVRTEERDGKNHQEPNGIPNSLGFVHSYDKNKGFSDLKSLLIKKHEEKIQNLTKSLEKLKKLELHHETR